MGAAACSVCIGVVFVQNIPEVLSRIPVFLFVCEFISPEESLYEYNMGVGMQSGENIFPLRQRGGKPVRVK